MHLMIAKGTFETSLCHGLKYLFLFRCDFRNRSGQLNAPNVYVKSTRILPYFLLEQKISYYLFL